jgi:site-specific DNA-methyltransferase (adenine-specific)/adenine-specific DNA-methyltransferase
MEQEGRIRIENTDSWNDLAGNRLRGVPEYLQTEDTPIDTNWTDVRGYVRSARYPTENPEELLERVILSSSNEGDIVLDAFAGSGTTPAVAEKLKRRWIAIDSSKLAIYTIQKRLLNLRLQIGNKGKALKPEPFTLFNAGLYDFSRLRELAWDGWRAYALGLFQCRDAPHKVKGITLDGYRDSDDVLIFNHTLAGGVMLDYGYIENLHNSIGARLGTRFFLIAPAASVAFLEDYVDLGSTRYYILRIPYSIINELHSRDFEAITQPVDETQINKTVEAIGFDFIRQPKVECEYVRRTPEGQTFDKAIIKITTFKSMAMVKGASLKENLESLSMVLVDYDYPYNASRTAEEPLAPFELDAIFYANDLRADNWQVHMPWGELGDFAMFIYMDIYGNEYTEIKSPADFRELA